GSMLPADSCLLNAADLHPDLRDRLRTAPAGCLGALGVAEHVPLPLRASLARADDVARVAVAAAAARLAQQTERRARDPVPRQRPRRVLQERHGLRRRHVAELRALALDDRLRIARDARRTWIVGRRR